MKRCSCCVLPETYPQISFDEQGICNFCSNYTGFVPEPEETLTRHFEMAKRKNRTYDALVPLSGGKDSTYILYLAKKVYGLNVLAYTFDNGFLSDIALENIKSAVEMLNVDHRFPKPNWDVLKRLYRNVLLRTGDLCAVCGIGIRNGSLKMSEDWRIPLILNGSSVPEQNSWSPENIYDIKRFKTILKNVDAVTDKEVRDFLIYDNLSPVRHFIYSKSGKFGETVSPLYYMPKKKEDDIREIVEREAGWTDVRDGIRGKKHFDCWAEPFTNYIREHRFGYSRRVCQYSNMIRLGEMTREEALRKLSEENPEKEPEITGLVLEKLEVSRDELNQILKIPLFEYDRYCYKTPRVPKLVKNILK